MTAMFLTLLIVASDTTDVTYASIPYESYQQCGEALGMNSSVWGSNGLMARCHETHIVTQSPTPKLNPNR